MLPLEIAPLFFSLTSLLRRRPTSLSLSKVPFTLQFHFWQLLQFPSGTTLRPPHFCPADISSSPSSFFVSVSFTLLVQQELYFFLFPRFPVKFRERHTFGASFPAVVMSYLPDLYRIRPFLPSSSSFSRLRDSFPPLFSSCNYSSQSTYGPSPISNLHKKFVQSVSRFLVNGPG